MATHSASNDVFPVLLIGAGFAMFGTPEGPWNITKRLEEKLGERLRVEAIVEVDPSRAETALSHKRNTSFPLKSAYKDTVIVGSVEEYKKRVESGQSNEPKAIFVATPPKFRGGLSKENDIELQIHKYFPSAPIFLEKPVATGTPYQQNIDEAKEVGKLLAKEHKAPVAVGYVLRYLKAVQDMKKIIEDKGLTVMATNSRLVVAYELAVKAGWWNKSFDQGPIVEQATHLCDLARYFGGDVDLDTLSAHALEAYEAPAKLSKMAFDESVIPEDLRIPRATTASWKYESGAVGSFLYAIALHDTAYSMELEVYADGYQFILADAWGSPQPPRLLVRRPGSNDVESYPPAGDDPYFTEIDHFIDTIENGPNAGKIFSSYEDAAATYELTWAIRNASEETSRKVKAKRAPAAGANGKKA